MIKPFLKTIVKETNTMKTNNEDSENEFPRLEKLKPENGFNTPEGYFDSLEDAILSKVASQPKERKLTNYRWLGYAASFAIIAGLSISFFLKDSTKTSLDEFGELTVNEYLQDISEIDLELDESLEFDEITRN